MDRFISWVNSDETIDTVLKAAIAHLWFVSIHPFDDGNGRIARALTDMLLARSENTGKRFYSVSAEMKLLQKEYYEVLERTQHGDGDITEWILWFLHCFEQALTAAENTLSSVLRKADFGNATEMSLSTRDSGSSSTSNLMAFWQTFYR